ncbi:MAG: helix-turn-helix domain-containing protein [Euzebya sp.]
MEPVASSIVGRPHGQAARGVARYVGYEYRGFPRRTQVGLPSTRPTMFISLADPVATLRGPDPAHDVTPLQAFIVDRLVEASDWASRFSIRDEVLAQRLSGKHRSTSDLRHGWQALTQPYPPSVSEVATTLGWSRRHLTRRFTNEVGLTPTQLRRISRIERSAPMLLDGWPIADVANRCGFFDQAHMTNEWRAIVHQTPRAWITAADEGATVLDVRPSSS